MRFGPLELQACGENNFTMKALGALAFSRTLRQRFVRLLVGEGEVDDEDDITLLFFSRIGEGFLREAIEREPHDDDGELEARFNAIAGLPRDLRWKRKEDGRLVQPAKWKPPHIEDMLTVHRSTHNEALRASLYDLKRCLNTEPDLVLQWRDRLVLVEIKVLSGEGRDQTGRQRRLGAFLSSLLGWRCDLRYIGPAHGRPPVDSGCRFVSWQEVADWFDDVPEVADYIREFRFFYRGAWQSMLSPHAEAPGLTAFDLMTARSTPVVSAAAAFASTDVAPSPAPPPLPASPPGVVPSNARFSQWHFAHLGPDYFRPIARAHRDARLPPLEFVSTGRLGFAYDQKALRRRVNPNWMIEVEGGATYIKRGGLLIRGEYDRGDVIRWTWREITERFGRLV